MSIKLRREVVINTILRASKPVLLRKANVLGEAMVKEATDIVRAEFITDRPPHRRRSGDIRLVNAFKYVVDERGNDVVVALTTKRGVADVKIRTLNNGSVPHPILPKGRFLTFPGQRASGTRKQSAITNAYSSDRSGRARVVDHPGRSATAKGTRFMQRARAAAVKRIT